MKCDEKDTNEELQPAERAEPSNDDELVRIGELASIRIEGKVVPDLPILRQLAARFGIPVDPVPQERTPVLGKKG